MPEALTWDRAGARWDGVVEDDDQGGNPQPLTWDGMVPDTEPTNPPTNMANDNLISAEITDEVKTDVKTKLGEIRTLLDFLVNLTPEEKRRTITIATERGAMDESFSTEMANHPELVPSFVDMDELAKDRALRSDLMEVLQDARELCEMLEDTLHVAGSDVMLGYLSFYNNVQQAAKRNVGGADTLLANLRRFMPTGRRASTPDPGENGDG